MRLFSQFQLLAVTALYEPPRKHMTKNDWEKVHCHGSQGCMMAKSKALSPPEFAVNSIYLSRHVFMAVSPG